MSNSIKTFLMFEGNAEEAMNFYTSLFDDSRIEDIQRYGAGEGGKEGSVMRATFTLHGKEYACIDSPLKHEFAFTPAMSLFVDCETEDEVDRLFAALSEGGEILMPLGAYPFARRYAWLNDRYGVSWQLSLEATKQA